MVYTQYIGSQSYYESDVSTVDARGTIYRYHERHEAHAAAIATCLTPPEWSSVSDAFRPI
jgi:hypothetical protein